MGFGQDLRWHYEQQAVKLESPIQVLRCLYGSQCLGAGKLMVCKYRYYELGLNVVA